MQLELFTFPPAWGSQISWRPIFKCLTALIFTDPQFMPAYGGHIPLSKHALERFHGFACAMLSQSN